MKTVASLIVAAFFLLPAAHGWAAQLWMQSHAKYGPYLADGKGRALYLFTKDKQGKGGSEAQSRCYKACATAWPPMTAESEPKAGEGVKADLIGMITRRGGQRQVTYNGWPLYTFAADQGKGAATGQDVKGFGGEWYLLTGSGEKVGHEKPGKNAKNRFKEAKLKAPEAVLYDAPRDRYIVSNINGKMLDRDGNGYISLLKPDGSVIKERWISADTGGVTLNAPKGMAISGGTLHVADIDTVRSFDIESGKPTGSLKIDGARFLNDFAVASDGTLYVTDSGTKDAPGAIYAIGPKNQVKKIASGRDLSRPNGIDVDGEGNLVVATFGSDKILSVSPKGKILGEQRLKAGQLDGLVVRKDGSRLVSSWKGKHVVKVTPDGKETVLLSGATTPAAFDVDTKRNLLVVPMVRENAIAVVQAD